MTTDRTSRSAKRAMAGFTLAVALLLLDRCGLHPVFAAKQSVSHVIDGDTIQIAGQKVFGLPTQIRVRALDTPESRYPQAKCDTEIIAGKAATAFARDMVSRSGGFIWTSGKPERDHYGRILFTVRLKLDNKRIDWAEAIISAGHGRAYLYLKDASGKRALVKPDWCAILRKNAAPVDLLHDTSFHDTESQP
jgi:endonuclease YncB( thermonuclease family)